MHATPAEFVVVGIGASAGGVEALQRFFAQVPPDSGCAYVVILHLSPEHESHLATLLQGLAPIPVALVTERVRVAPDHVYVVPPSQHLTMADGEIVVTPNTQPAERRAPIDLFFSSLGDTQGARAVGVLLSGTGADGLLGLKRIKARGGVVFVQDAAEALWGDMPRGAIATGLADDVLPAAAIPARIVAYRAGLSTIRIPVAPEQRPEAQQQALRELFALMRIRTGHDFTDYERPTLLRQIERRMNVLGMPDLPAYVAYLRDRPEEAAALLSSLPISVTTFFRDNETFAAREQEALPRAAELTVGAAEPATRLLEEEVMRLRQELRASGARYEYQAEILKSTNKELRARNEELRSSTEELETSKEELQSVNEELRTVNQELKAKIEEASLHSTNLQNLLASSEVGTIFLDRDLQIKLFTPAAGRLFNLIATDRDRPIADVTHRMVEYDVIADAERVLSMFQSIEREVRTADGETYLLRLLPYRVSADRVGGVVLTFFDVTARRRVEERQALLLKLSDALRPLSDPEAIQFAAALTLGEYLGANRVGYAEDQGDGGTIVVTRNYTDGVPGIEGRYHYDDYGPELLRAFRAGRTVVRPDIANDPTLTDEEKQAHAALQLGATVNVPLVKDGRLVAVLFLHQSTARHWSPDEVALLEDVAARTWDAVERARAEAALRESEARLQLALEAAEMGTFLWHVAEDRGEPDGRMLALFGLPRDGTLTFGAALATLIHPDDRAGYAAAFARACDPAGDGVLRHDIRVTPPDGGERWLAITARVYFAGDPRRPTQMYGTALDITARKQAEEALRRTRERQTFLLAISDALGPLFDANEVHAAVTDAARRYFNADRCYYCEIEGGHAIIRRDSAREGLPSVVGVYSLDSLPIFRAVIDAGRPFVVPDVHTTDMLDESLRQLCIQLQIISFLDVPLIKGGRPVGILCVTQVTPREWTSFEVELAVETAERTWGAVERARAETALRASEARLQLALEAAGMGTFLWHVAEDRGEPDEQMLALFGTSRDGALSLREALATLIHPDDRAGYAAAVARACDPAGDGVLRHDIRVTPPDGGERWLAITARVYFAGDPRRPTQMYGTALDITARKRAEAQVHAALEAEQAARRVAEAASARTTQLQAITAGLADALTPETVYIVIADHGAAATGARAVAVALLDPADALLRLVGWTGRSAEIIAAVEPIALSAPLPMPAAVHTRVPVWLTTRDEAEARFPGFSALMAGAAVQSLAVLPLLVDEHVLGAISFGYSTAQAFSAEERGFLCTLAQQCAQALERVRLYRELQASQARLQHLSQRLIEAQEQERRHLARELHDEVGQALTGLRLELELLGRLPPEARAVSLARAQETTQQLIGQIQTLALDLRPAMLDDQGLLPAVLWLITRYREQTGIVVELRQRGLDQRLPPQVETVAYRVVQESLTNIARHAGVERATVALLITPSHLLVQVRDEGRGFVLEEALASGRSSGLLGMYERVALLDGLLSIDTAPGAGTAILAELPVAGVMSP